MAKEQTMKISSTDLKEIQKVADKTSLKEAIETAFILLTPSP